MFDANKLDDSSLTHKEEEWTEKLLGPLEEAELLELRSAISERLPMSLRDLDMQTELVLQYRMVKALLNKVANDTVTPANQKAQLVNSCSAIIAQISKLQLGIYTAERLKMIEQVLIRAIRDLPEPVQRQFFEEYERLGNTHTHSPKETPNVPIPATAP